MKISLAVNSMHQAFVEAERLVHSSPHRGVFVLSNDSSRFHSLLWSEYPVTSIRGPLIPRLHIDRMADQLPTSIATIWRIERDAMFAPVGLEITVLEDEICTLSAALPAIVAHIEMGEHSGFDTLLPFPTARTSDTNIWSVAAESYARTSKA